MKTIKTILFAAVLGSGLFALNGCNKLLKVDKTIDGGSITFFVDPQAGLVYDIQENKKIGMDALLDPYGVSTDNIKSLKVSEATVELIDTTVTPVTFDIVDNGSVEIATATIPVKTVAKKDPMPKGGLSVIQPDLEPDVDYLPYAKADDVMYHLKLKLNTALTHRVKMKVTLKYKVVAEL